MEILSVMNTSVRGSRHYRLTVNITDRKRAEENSGKLEQQLRQAQKMEPMGRLGRRHCP